MARAIRNGASTFTQEGISLQLTTPLTVGNSYRISIMVKYGIRVFSDPGFDSNVTMNCFNLRFVFANSNQNGRPTVFDAEIDGGDVYGSKNSDYHEYEFTFTATDNFTHLYIVTAASDANAPGHEFVLSLAQMAESCSISNVLSG